MDHVSPEVLDAAVKGTRLAEPETLRGQLDPHRPTLVNFLRHFGCCFCREIVKDLRIASEQADGHGGERRYPKVVFVHMADVATAGSFFGKYWPGATSISDPDKRLYHAFGLTRGTLGQMFGPSSFMCGIRAVRKGHGIGKAVGDPWMMPGQFLLEPSVPGESARISWRYEARHAGDHPDVAALASEGGTVSASPR
ncbi:MAG: SelL-related redox protein [Planctomycetota bacterium]